MKDIKNINTLYKYIESQSSFEFPVDRNIEKSFQRLEKEYKQKKLKNKCKAEMFVWGFRIDDGKVLPIMTNTSKDGKTILEYPSLNDFNDEDLHYLKFRSEIVKNYYLKARYNHILWESKFKHKKFAHDAIDAYFKHIELIKDKGLSLTNFCKSLIILSSTSNSKIVEVNNCINNLTQNDNLKDYEINQLGDFYLENIKSKNCIDNLKLIHEKCSFSLFKKSNESIVIPQLCDTLIKISKRINLDFKLYYQKKAEYYLGLVDGEDSWVKQSYYFDAIKAYVEIGEKEKIDDLYVLLENSKEDIRLNSYNKESSGVEIQNLFKSIDEFTDKLTDSNSNEIYNYLALSNRYLPSAEVFYKKPKSSFLDTIPTTSFDINSNFTKGDKRNSINQYWMHITYFTERELGWIFYKGIEKGTISYHSLMEYLYEKSWIGKKYYDKDFDGKSNEYSLMQTLSPALFDFFRLSEAQIKRKNFDNTGYVLCVDSLTLKIEGLIRHFAKLINCPTIIINKKKNGTRERYIEEIITHQKFKDYFSDEDLVFILFIMTNKGMNLRNNIAHSFYKYENYSVSIMFLLITILLRLGKFELKFTKKN